MISKTGQISHLISPWKTSALAGVVLCLGAAGCGFPSPGAGINPIGTTPSGPVSESIAETRSGAITLSRAPTPTNATTQSVLPVPSAASGLVHRVRAGETYYTIAKDYAVNLYDIIVINDLRPPFQPVAGESLIIPGQSVHKVAPGDSLYKIAQDYGVDLSMLTQLNGLEPPYVIRVGMQIRLPSPVAVTASTVPSANTSATPIVLPQPAPVRTSVVREPAIETATPEPQDQAVVTSSPAVNNQAANPQSAELPENLPDNLPLPPRRPVSTALASPPALDPKGFIWPLKGRILTRFGPIEKGLKNDGLNIAAPVGAPVRAAQNGIVAYSGDALKGFGQLVLIKHDRGYVTAYAHNQAILVKAGQQVQRGQVIARAGDSGNVSSPQLHFQLRKGQKSLDPQPLLKG